MKCNDKVITFYSLQRMVNMNELDHSTEWHEMKDQTMQAVSTSA